MNRYLIVTDLEGVSGVDSFRQTRKADPVDKNPGMKQLAREVNACVEGIRMEDPDAEVDVIDGHGSGGLFPEDLKDCHYFKPKDFQHDLFPHYKALLFVGQHAMAGTFDAPLCHTYNSLTVQYYRLNEVYIGEFAAIANWAGLNGVPTIFLSGDDKAALEARIFIPNIETVVTKFGQGFEAAVHLDPEEVCQAIRLGAVKAVRRMAEIHVFYKFQPPYRFEARFYEPANQAAWSEKPHVKFIDDRTYRIETDDYKKLPFF